MKEVNDKILLDVNPATNGLKNILKALERDQGGGIVNQQVQLQTTIGRQAIKTGVDISDTRSAATVSQKTNEFYEEQSVKISFESQEQQLVNFLYNIGNDPAMIRVRELDLKAADANRYRLRGDALLSANYPRKVPVAATKTAAPAAPAGKQPPAAAPKPGAAPLPKQIPGPKSPRKMNNAPGARPAHQNL
jgi:hypothetical protein